MHQSRTGKWNRDSVGGNAIRLQRSTTGDGAAVGGDRKIGAFALPPGGWTDSGLHRRRGTDAAGHEGMERPPTCQGHLCSVGLWCAVVHGKGREGKESCMDWNGIRTLPGQGFAGHTEEDGGIDMRNARDMVWQGHDLEKGTANVPGQVGWGRSHSAQAALDGNGVVCHPHQSTAGRAVGT